MTSRRKQHAPRHVDFDDNDQPSNELKTINTINAPQEKLLEMENCDNTDIHSSKNHQHIAETNNPVDTKCKTRESTSLSPTVSVCGNSNTLLLLDYHKKLYIGSSKSEPNTINHNCEQDSSTPITNIMEMEEKECTKKPRSGNDSEHCYFDQSKNEKDNPTNTVLNTSLFDQNDIMGDDQEDDVKTNAVSKSIEYIVSEFDKDNDECLNNNGGNEESITHHSVSYENNDDEEDEIDETNDDDLNNSSTNPPNNVKLEALKNTRVAVAQIVENNFPNSDMVPSLMQTIYTLWQQQMMQCHMLEVVRQHLIKIAHERNIQLPNIPQVPEQLTMSMFTHGASTTINSTENADLDDSINSPVSPSCSISEIDDEDECDLLHDGNMHSHNTNTPRKLPPQGHFISVNNSNPPNNYPPSSISSSINMSVSNALPNNTDTVSPCAGTEAPRMERTEALHVGKDGDQSRHQTNGNASIFRHFQPHHDSAEDPLFRYKCRICSKVFGSDSSLQLHARSHLADRVYECDVCTGKFPTRGHLQIHYEHEHLKEPITSRQHHEMEINGTPMMSRPSIFGPPRDLPHLQRPGIPSMMNSPPNEITRADMIDRQTASKRYSPVADEHSKNNPVQRPLHFNMINSSNQMTGSIPPVPLPSTHQPMPSPFGSPPGMSPFYRPSFLPTDEDDDSELEQFMEIDKSETSKLEEMVKNIDAKITDPNMCAICKRILSCRSALQMHYRTHTGERPFRCKICRRAFTTKGNLKTHMGVHKMKPPLRPMHHCPMCQKQFTNPLVLHQHMQNHSNNDIPRMFPGGPPPGMLGPAPFMSFNGLPIMPPHMMGKFPPMMFPRFRGFDMRKPLEYEDDLLSESGEDLDDYKSDGISKSEADAMSEAGESNMKRYRINEDEDSESIKRQKVTDYESESTDDEEVPREISDESIEADKLNNSNENIAERNTRTPPRTNPLFQQSKYLNHNNDSTNGIHSSYSTSLSALENRVKELENRDNEESNITQEINHRSEGTNHGVGKPPYLPGDAMNQPGISPSARQATTFSSPPGSAEHSGSSEISQERHTPSKPDNPHGSETPLLKPYNFLDLPLPMSFSAGRPGLGTTCDVCFKTFACKSALEIHYRSHTKEKPFRCALCDRGFSTRGNLKQHFLTHKIRDLQEAGVDTTHADTWGDNSNDTTPLSSKDAMDNIVNNMTNHQEPHSPKTSPDKPEGGYQPPEIERPNHYADDRPHHPYSFTGAVPSHHILSQAEQFMESEKSETSKLEEMVKMPTHHILKHVCNSSSERPVNPVQPVQRESRLSEEDLKNGGLKHMCKVCLKPFSSSSALQIHMRTHTGERPFKCTECGKGFTTKGNLKVHMSTHEDRASFTRRGRRMSMDGMPIFDGFPPHPMPRFHGLPGAIQTLHKGPGGGPPHDFFIPRFPYMGVFPPGLNGFMPPRPNEIPVIQTSTSSAGTVPIGMMSPERREYAMKVAAVSASMRGFPSPVSAKESASEKIDSTSGIEHREQQSRAVTQAL